MVNQTSRRNIFYIARTVALAMIVFPTLVACDDSPLGELGPGEGRVRISVTGFATDATDAGSLTVVIPGSTPTLIPLPTPVGGVSSGAADIAAGSGTLTYNPPADYEVVDGQSETWSISVAEGATVELNWAVVPSEAPVGTLHVTVDGFEPGTSQPGAVSAQPESGPSIAIALQNPGNGQTTGSGNVEVGSYDVTYTPPAGHSLASGESATKTATVSEGSTVQLEWDVTPDEDPVGSLRVEVSGFSPGASQPGSASAEPESGSALSLSLAAPSGGTAAGTRVVPVGSYQVTYTPPSGYSLADGEQATKTATVSEGNTAQLEWDVTLDVVPVGSLRVEVSGFAAGANQPGSASAVPLSGLPVSLSLATPSNGTAAVTLVVPVGSYQVTYTPPSGYSLAPGGTSTKAAVVVSGGVDTVTWQVEESDDPNPGLVWENIWLTNGQSVAAVLGTGFTSVSGSGTDRLTVIDKPSDWPSAARGKVLEVVYGTSVGGSRVVRAFPWAPFSSWGVGEYRHLFFFYEAVPAGAGSSDTNNGYHGHEALDASLSQLNPWSLGRNNDDELVLQFRIKEDGSGGATNRFDMKTANPLERGVVYQIEEAFQNMGSGTVRIHLRVWSGDGSTLLLETEDFSERHGTLSMMGYDVDLGGNQRGMEGFTFGTNGGASGKDNWTDRYADVRSWFGNELTWIGPVR